MLVPPKSRPRTLESRSGMAEDLLNPGSRIADGRPKSGSRIAENDTPESWPRTACDPTARVGILCCSDCPTAHSPCVSPDCIRPSPAGPSSRSQAAGPFAGVSTLSFKPIASAQSPSEPAPRAALRARPRDRTEATAHCGTKSTSRSGTKDLCNRSDTRPTGGAARKLRQGAVVLLSPHVDGQGRAVCHAAVGRLTECPMHLGHARGEDQRGGVGFRHTARRSHDEPSC
eukprot:scaffold6743_cov118-Isochrysis_galbana.AAC.2